MVRYINYIFLIFVITLVACNQNQLGVGYALRNLIKSPIDGISGLVSDSRYRSIESRRSPSLVIPSGHCSTQLTESVIETDSIESLSNTLRDTVCQCKSWGSCTKDVCECSILCPNNFEIFKREYVENISDYSKQEHSLAFRNTGGGSKYEATQGYCWGHSSITSKFNRLAFFNPNKAAPFDLSSENYDEQMRAVEYYKEKVDEIIRNNVAEIPGFDNLQSFSSHPALQSYIADKVATSWASRAMSFQGLGIVLSSSPDSEQENRERLNEIMRKIDNNQQPQILFNSNGSATSAHVVLVSNYVREDDGTVSLCIRDNNLSPDSNHRCHNKLQLRNGSFHYSAWGDLGKVKIAHNDNADTLDQFESLKRHCSVKYNCEI